MAVLIFVLGLVLGFDNDKYGKVPLPGEGRVTLPQGDVTVYYEERNSFPSGLLSYTVRSADTRRPVPSRPSGSASYEINNLEGTSVDKLTVPREGEYLVRGRTRASAFNQPALTFGPGMKFGTIAVRALAAIVIGLVLCVLFALLARAFRRRPTARDRPAAALQRAHGGVADAPAAPAAARRRRPPSGDGATGGRPPHGPHRRGRLPGPAQADPRPDLIRGPLLASP